MMSNCNSPLLDRASPFRANSVDRGDAYQVRKEKKKFFCRFSKKIDIASSSWRRTS